MDREEEGHVEEDHVDPPTSPLHLTARLCLHKNSNSTSREAIPIWQMGMVMVALEAGPSEGGMVLVDAPHEGDFLVVGAVVAPLVAAPLMTILVGTQNLGTMQKIMKVTRTHSDLHLIRASGLLRQGNLEVRQTSQRWVCDTRRLMCGKTPTTEVGAGGRHPEAEVGFLLASGHLHHSGQMMRIQTGVECLLRSGGEGRQKMTARTCCPAEDAPMGSHHVTLSHTSRASHAAHRHPLTGSEKRSLSETGNPSKTENPSQSLPHVPRPIQSLLSCPSRERSQL